MNLTNQQTSRRLFAAFVCLCVFSLCSVTALAHGTVSMILCREEVATKRQQELAEQLRAITGWSDLHFDNNGALRAGEATPTGGSKTARALLTAVQKGPNLIVIEDASGQADVVFGRVVEAQWKGRDDQRPPAFVVQLDFTDFSQVIGDQEALAAFNAAWVALHEIYHVTNDATDTTSAGETGECEELINLMRRECKLAVRAEYHFHLVPLRNDHKTRFVRLAFERENPMTNKKSRVWLMWDAVYVGGLR